MREIIFDTETTGFDPKEGHRLVELGAVEVFNAMPTGEKLHMYFNPERDVPAEATQVHGLTNAFLDKQPLFADQVAAFLDFIGDAPLVAHNASFDQRFINAELTALGYPALAPSRFVDTLVIAKRLFPGAPASLDALCRRFQIDLSSRTLHGALLDAELLAAVYLELKGGRQISLIDDGQKSNKDNNPNNAVINAGVLQDKGTRQAHRAVRVYPLSSEEEERHALFIKQELPKNLWG